MESASLSLEACCTADMAFHRTVIEASHNVVLQTMVGTIETILTASFRLTTSLMENQARTLGVHKRVLEAIRVHDTASARTAMNNLLPRSTRAPTDLRLALLSAYLARAATGSRRTEP